MVFGCLRRCGMNSSDDDLVPYERAAREIPRLGSDSPLSPPTQPHLMTPHSTHRKITMAIDQNDTFVPLLCSTKIAGSAGHHRSVSLLGGEGSFRDLILERCHSLNDLDEKPPQGARLLRHDHYSTEKFMSTSTVVLVDASKIAGDRSREGEEEPGRLVDPIPLEPVVKMIKGPLPMEIEPEGEEDEEAIRDIMRILVSRTVNEEREVKEEGDRSAIGELVREIMTKMEKAKEEEDCDWRETPLLNQTQSLSPIVEERKWKVLEDEEENPISRTPLSRFSSKRANKLKIREDVSPPPIDRPICLKTPQEMKALQDLRTPEEFTGEKIDSVLEQAPLRPSFSRMGVAFNGSRVEFSCWNSNN